MRELTFGSMLTAAAMLSACGGGGSDTPQASDNPVASAPSGGSATEAPAANTPAQRESDGGTPPVPDQSKVSLPEANTTPIPLDAGSPVPNIFSSQVINDPFLETLVSFPTSNIVSGGPPKDGIPALTNPSTAASANFLSDDDLVLGVVINGEAKAYPHNIGWWHEIINDRVGGHPVSVTFCPLTSTGLVFDAEDDDGTQFELGVSGLLFNNNLILYDRRDNNTLYPQIYFTGIEGERQGESLTLLPVVETRWSTWKRLHPDSKVVNSGTYNQSQYTRYPYGDYRTNDNFLIFGLSPRIEANRNPAAQDFGAKDQVLGVRLNGEAKAYPFDKMGSRTVINDQVGGTNIVVMWDQGTYLALPYAREVDGQTLTFEAAEGGFPFNLQDIETGTVWNANGVAIEGPLAEAGAHLTQVPAHNSMWFAWVTFWQDTGVWSN